MSIIDPVRTRLDLRDLDIGFQRFPNVQPFSQRSASGYQESLEGVIAWTQRTLIPYLREASGQTTWDANVDKLLAAIDAVLLAQNSDVQTMAEDAVNTVINAHIEFTDPVVLGVLNAADSDTLAKLRELFDLTNDDLMSVVANNPGNSTFRNWLNDTFAAAETGVWTFGWGGDGNARAGDNGGAVGNYQHSDKRTTAHARLIFGSLAISGGGVISGLSNLGNLRLDTVDIRGTYEVAGQAPRDVIARPITSNDAKVWTDRGNGWEVFNVLGDPPQSSFITLHVDGFQV